MTELLKDYFEVWTQRVRSPLGGYTVFAFLIFNWREVFFLLFSEQSAAIRIRFFDLRTSWLDLIVLPIIIGALLAFVTPWLNYIIVQLIKKPVGKHRQLQTTESISNKIHQINDSTRIEKAEAENENVRETRKIEGAQRLELAKKVQSEGLEEEILAEREALSIEKQESVGSSSSLLESLSQLEKAVIITLGNASTAQTVARLVENNYLAKIYSSFTKNGNLMRFGVDLHAAIDSLARSRIVTSSKMHGEVKLTTSGYSIFDKLA